MLLAWPRDDVRDLCCSHREMRRALPHHYEVAQDLVSAVIAARDLGRLAQFRSIEIHPRGQHGRIRISLEEIEMYAHPISNTGELLVEHDSHVTALLVEALQLRPAGALASARR